ncbi:MAG: hypothetical protein ACRCY8_17685 [Dermatophilaceae bacterium]
MPDAVREDLTRRRLLTGLAGGAAAAVAGCGIQLEDGAPSLPLVPTREPVPGEDALIALSADSRRLADLAARLPGALGVALAGLHGRQYSVLRAALLDDGVPARLLDSPTPSSGPTSSGSTPATGPDARSGTRSSSAPAGTPRPSQPPGTTAAAVAAAEAAGATAAARFPTVAPSLRAMVAALHAQRFAAVVALTGAAPVVAGGSVGGGVLRDLAGRTTAAAYLVEVAAARSTTAQRARAETTLARLRSLSADHRALGADPEPAAGVPLPFPVRGTADAARLTRAALTALRDEHGRVLADLVADSGGAGLAVATRWLGTVEAECHRWGAALEPFPGLR